MFRYLWMSSLFIPIIFYPEKSRSLTLLQSLLIVHHIILLNSYAVIYIFQIDNVLYTECYYNVKMLKLMFLII